METGIQTTGTTESDFFENHCNESCPWDRWFKGGCNCPEQLRLIEKFKRDVVHELYLEMVSGVGA